MMTMNANMTVTEQRRLAVSKGNQVVRTIRRNITYRDLELCIQAWKPHLKNDINRFHVKCFMDLGNNDEPKVRK